jgi:Helix-turn-helix domain
MTQRDTVYSMLRRAHKDGVTNGAFAEAGILRYSARIRELRREGHPIARQRLSARCWKYTLLNASPAVAVPSAQTQPTPGHKPMSPYEYEREVA